MLSLHTFLLEQCSASVMAYEQAWGIAGTLHLEGCPAKCYSWALHRFPGNGLRQGGELWCHCLSGCNCFFSQATASLRCQQSSSLLCVKQNQLLYSKV